MMTQPTRSPLGVKPVIRPKPKVLSSPSSFPKVEVTPDESTQLKNPVERSSKEISEERIPIGSSASSASSHPTNSKHTKNSPFAEQIEAILKRGPLVGFGPSRSISLTETEPKNRATIGTSLATNLIDDAGKDALPRNEPQSLDLDEKMSLLMNQIEDSMEMPMLDSWPIDELSRLLDSHRDIDEARIDFILQWNCKVNDLLDQSGFSQSSIYRNVASLILSQLNFDQTSALNCLTDDKARALIATYESMLEQNLGCQPNEDFDYKSEPNDFGINPRLWREATANIVQASQAPLRQRCEICFEEFPPTDIFGLSCCQCIICNTCMRDYFSGKIRDGHVTNFVCPVCHCPDIDEDTLHFQLLEPKLKFLLPEEDFVSYQEKMTEWNLMKNPNFRLCINADCHYGFLIPESGIRRVECPECKMEMCSQCKKPWETQHEGLSCETFREWKRRNDSRFQEEGLAMQLQENGIYCPRCHRCYLLSKGGCIHFSCTYCHYEFCSACSRPFVRACKKTALCKQSGGLHCHHPRNCLYYLRDKSVRELQKLLEKKGSEYESSSRIEVDFCPIVEEKDAEGGFIQEACKKSVLSGHAGLCEIHYKEYLAEVVLKDGIDPVDIMNENELIRELENTGFTEIPKKYREETSDQYRERLIRTVVHKVPLENTNSNSKS